MAVRGELEGAFARLDACGTDAELVELCKRCLAPRRDDRPRHAGEVAAAAAGYLAQVEQRAQRAELDRAAAEARVAEEANTRREAEARAAEERKRRRTQLALAGCVLLLVSAGGAFGWWADRRERERAAERSRQLAAAEEVVAAAVGQAYRDIQAGRPGDARRGLEGVEGQFEGGGLPAGARDQLAAARLDADMVVALEEARLLAAGFKPGEVPLDFAAAAEAYRAAFERYGLPVLALEADEAARRVRDSKIATHLILALDEWALATGVAENAARAGPFIVVGEVPLRLYAVARRSDDDSWRAALREGADRLDAGRLRALAADPAAVAQPPAAVLRLARCLAASDGWPAAVDLMRRTWARNPADFWLNFYLGAVWLDSDDDGAAPRAVGYLRAAAALRPDSPLVQLMLASALSASGEADEAADTCRVVIRLSPGFGEAYLLLGQVLRGQGKTARAIRVLEEGTRAARATAELHKGLAELLESQVEEARAASRSPEAAAAYYSGRVQVDPEDAFACNGLAWVRATGPTSLRNGAEAVRLATRACELTGWGNPNYIDTLAAAHAETGNFARAAEYQKKALAVTRAGQRYETEWRARLALYERGQPYRDPRLNRREVAPPPREVKR